MQARGTGIKGIERITNAALNAKRIHDKPGVADDHVHLCPGFAVSGV